MMFREISVSLALTTLTVRCVQGLPPGIEEVRVNSGRVVELTLPADLSANQTEARNTVFLAIEREDFVMPWPSEYLVLDATRAGKYGPNDRNPNVPEPGFYSVFTRDPINSYLVHMDPVSGINRANVEISFSETVIGVIFQTESLNLSDPVVGTDGTTYPNSERLRGLELDQPDSIFIGYDFKSVQLSLDNLGAMDQVRIITAERPGLRFPDLTGDGIIDAADAGALFINWGVYNFDELNPDANQSDFNRDGVVDAADAGWMFQNWSTRDEIQPIPEPAALSLFLASLLSVCAVFRPASAGDQGRVHHRVE